MGEDVTQDVVDTAEVIMEADMEDAVTEGIILTICGDTEESATA